MFKLNKSVLIITGSLILGACGGSSSSSSTPEITPPPPDTAPPDITQTTGVITVFGSVFVNGVEYETDGAQVSTDDNDDANESDLQVGMIVSLSGSVNDDGSTGEASSIHYAEQIKGPLTSIDFALNLLVVLGQTVVFDELTSLDNLILADLAPGDFLEISGFFNADGDLYATRIEKEDVETELKFQGLASGLNTELKTFILGELTIDYSDAEFDEFVEADLANDLQVKVKGDVAALIDNVFSISKIELVSSEDNDHEDGDKRHLEGIITSFESSSSFIVEGVHVITDDNTEFEHGTSDSLLLNVRVKIKGQFDAEGNLLAKEIRIHQRTNLKVEGPLQAVDHDASTVTVRDVVFIVDDHTKMEDESDIGERFFNLDDLVESEFVEVKGFVDNEGNIIATKLDRENENDDNETELKGIVSDISNPVFTIVGIVVTTNDTTQFDGVDGADVSMETFFAQLQDGMLVEVKGGVVNDEFVAVSVEIENDTDDEAGQHSELRSIVEELSETSFVVAGHTVLINSDTEFEFNDEVVSFEQFLLNVSVGDQVKIEGIIDDQGVITAESVEFEADS